MQRSILISTAVFLIQIGYASGGIDRISLADGQRVMDIEPMTNKVYTSIAATGDWHVFGMTPNGGIDLIDSIPDGWATHPVITDSAYIAFSPFGTNRLYAINVPEPATLLLLGVGGMMVRRRR